VQVQHDAKWIKTLSALSKRYFTPTFLSSEYIDASRPAMYVGNHSLYGIFDAPVIIIICSTNIRWLWSVLPTTAIFICRSGAILSKKFGAVDGQREYVRALMQQGYSILVFPGGGREVLKHPGEQYQLIWKQRYGFLQLAQEFQYDIIPFAAFGPDDIFEFGFDARTVVQHRLFQKLLTVPQLDKLLRHGDVIPSLPKHLIPKRVPFYSQFLPPVEVGQRLGSEDLAALREEIAQQIYQTLAQLKARSTGHPSS